MSNSYALLDSGDRYKLERFGRFIVARPEPQALWAKNDPNAWKSADIEFVQKGEDGDWKTAKKPGEDWRVAFDDLVFGLKLYSFKHVGIFPEQSHNWRYLKDHVRPGMKMLNLFGYTGGATLAGLSAGAEVVHVDASKPAILGAKKNAELSGLIEKPVRWIEDDAMKFIEREGRRGNLYDVVVMDPPAFGRGPNKEVWQFEDHFRALLVAVKRVTKKGSRVLINAYSMGFSQTVVEQTARDVFGKVESIESVELHLTEETDRAFVVPGGITIRLVL